MNKDWSEKNKEIQVLLGKEATYREGIEKLLLLRNELFEQIAMIVNGFPKKAFYEMPFANAKGYHSKTLSYSIWHIFRIEDIVAHELITGNVQVYFEKGFDKTLGSPIITTGNELVGEAIKDFSEKLDVQILFDYAKAVMESSNEILQRLTYQDLKRKFDGEDKEKLRKSGCVSEDANAIWLIDYWCSKDVAGLLKMPFSRHWMMHIAAMQRIKNQLCRQARKGVDPVAYCGFYCNHCFLSQWCGSCRTDYNTCSFATICPDKKCPNVSCCQAKGLDGCYECDKLESCHIGFYTPDNDGANAARVQAMFIRKYGKKAFIQVHNKKCEHYDFAKNQEILGQDKEEGFRI